MPSDPQGWRPIETAPRDHSVLIASGNWMAIAYQTNHGEPFKESWRYAGGPGRGQQTPWPTHWQPLPAPPADPAP